MTKKKEKPETKEKKEAAKDKDPVMENIDTAAEETPIDAAEDKAPEDENSDAGREAEDTAEKKDPRDEKIEELNDRNLRLMAEFENFRKRTDKEKEQMFDNGAKSVIEKVLPVIDNFERALDMVPAEDADDAETDPFMDGMRKVYKQLMDELDKIGVRAIDAVGQEFNPEFHNAVMQVDSEEYDSGIIARELQKGYMYNDSVVRHSMVGVAK